MSGPIVVVLLFFFFLFFLPQLQPLAISISNMTFFDPREQEVCMPAAFLALHFLLQASEAVTQQTTNIKSTESFIVITTETN